MLKSFLVWFLRLCWHCSQDPAGIVPKTLRALISRPCGLRKTPRVWGRAGLVMVGWGNVMELVDREWSLLLCLRVFWFGSRDPAGIVLKTLRVEENPQGLGMGGIGVSG